MFDISSTKKFITNITNLFANQIVTTWISKKIKLNNLN